MRSTIASLRVIALLASLAPLCGCQEAAQSEERNSPAARKRSIIVDGPLVTLDQGWSDSDAEWFYNISQGSRLVPYDWMKFLKTPEGKPFIESSADFGFIARNSSDENQLGLPVGFAKDMESDEERSWVGLTCAACHTALIDNEDTWYLIDGAPALADFQGFLESLAGSLEHTHENDAAFKGFADDVLGGNASSSDREALREAVKRIAEKRSGYNDRNLPTDAKFAFGFGRVDAFGAILNEVMVRFVGVNGNHAEANAPVNPPHLWDTPQHDFVQWNGAAPNGELKSLARNVGEVLGVFGDLEIPATPPKVGYKSTVQIENLREIEDRLEGLMSPVWPWDIKEEARTRGKGLFIQHCAGCHTLNFERDDEDREIFAHLEDVGTDPLMSSNFRKREGATGPKLENKQRINFNPIGPTFGARAPGDALLIHSVVGTILGGWKDEPVDELEDLKLRKPLLKANETLNEYKARPLNGIWATAPYLHNGSVPTLRDLLKPVNKRPSEFWVGSRRFNTTDIGFESTEASGGLRFDTSVAGNWNTGHEYGAELDDDPANPDAVNDLLEFLKSL